MFLYVSILCICIVYVLNCSVGDKARWFDSPRYRQVGIAACFAASGCGGRSEMIRGQQSRSPDLDFQIVMFHQASLEEVSDMMEAIWLYFDYTV